MNIDFHHGVIYILSRLAGFKPEQANIIAYSSQYVDDACNQGVVSFSNNPNAKYYRIKSAQDLQRLAEITHTYVVDPVYHQHVWVPFHFLPGNAGRTIADGDEGISFLDKMICKANSPVAKDMINECFRHKSDANALHRLGITMHVYADTWAHQEFVGIQHEVNDVDDIDTGSFNNVLDNTANKLVPLLGHGRALHFPDYPFIKEWSYLNGQNQIVKRFNHSDFVGAADNIYKVMQRFINPDEPVREFHTQDIEQINYMLRETTSENERERHAAWMGNIRDGAFTFGPEEPPFYPINGKGMGSWKYDALNTEEERDDRDIQFLYNKDFLTSNWKMFHDALQSHRFYILHDLLPQYGILCCLPG